MSSRSKDSRQLDQGRQLCRAAQDRLAHFAGQLAVLDDQFVRPVLLKADHRRDRVGEQREAAGDQAGIGAVGAHGHDQLTAARRRRDARFQHLVDHADRQTLEQRDALAQRRLELDLAAHRPFGDLGDMRLQPGEVGQFVDAFLADHGGIHVGQKKLLAPDGCEAARQCRSAGRRAPARRRASMARDILAAVEGDVDRHFVEQPVRWSPAKAARRARRRRWWNRARGYWDCR